MKILLFSDIHFQEGGDFSRILPDGSDSRLADLLAVVQRLAVIYKRYGCKAVVFGGDLFHHPRSIVTRVYQKAYAALEELAGQVDRLVLIAGNHDQALFQTQQATSLYALKNLPNTQIVLEPSAGAIGDETIFLMLPYLDDKHKVLTALQQAKPGSVVVSHCGLTEAVIGPNEIQIQAPLTLKDVEGFKAAFFGHYHKAQSLTENVHIIGSPVQHNMLDRGDKRGVIVYDTDTNQALRVWLKGPKFHLFEVGDMAGLKAVLANDLKDGYVRVLLTTKTIPRDQVTELLAKAGARASQVRYAVMNQAQARNEALTTKLLSCGLDEALGDYVKHVQRDGLEPERLIKTGQQLLKDYDTNETA